MARALRLQFEDATYHICARGNRRDVIFSDDKDRFRFLELVQQSLRRYDVQLHAYVLLPNHFHFLAQTRRANLSRWMHWLSASYSIWFNRRHRSNGHLFQGRYKSFLVQGGQYLLGLSRYIHLNPVRGRVLGAGNPTARRGKRNGVGGREMGEMGSRLHFVHLKTLQNCLTRNRRHRPRLRSRLRESSAAALRWDPGGKRGQIRVALN